MVMVELDYFVFDCFSVYFVVDGFFYFNYSGEVVNFLINVI